jgi:hypothetical protein
MNGFSPFLFYAASPLGFIECSFSRTTTNYRLSIWLNSGREEIPVGLLFTQITILTSLISPEIGLKSPYSLKNKPSRKSVICGSPQKNIELKGALC